MDRKKLTFGGQRHDDRWRSIRPVRIEVESDEGENHWLSVTVREGKNWRGTEHHGASRPEGRTPRSSGVRAVLIALPRGGIEEVPQKMLKKALREFFEGERNGGRVR